MTKIGSDFILFKDHLKILDLKLHSNYFGTSFQPKFHKKTPKLMSEVYSLWRAKRGEIDGLNVLKKFLKNTLYAAAPVLPPSLPQALSTHQSREGILSGWTEHTASTGTVGGRGGEDKGASSSRKAVFFCSLI